jgi:hypothetical protein
MSQQFALVAALTTAVAVAMSRAGLWTGLLRIRNARRCPSCGRLVSARVCRNCGKV